MPTAMHFFNLQYWHRLRLILRMEHCWFLVQGLYWIFCWMERRKKPCGSQLQLESRSASELSSLEQPESLDSRPRRASSMLTSTECRSRSSAPHDIALHSHYHTTVTSLRALRYGTGRALRCTFTDGGWRLSARPLRRAAHS